MSALGQAMFEMEIEDLKKEREEIRKNGGDKFEEEFILEVDRTGYKKTFKTEKEAIKQYNIANEIYVPKLYRRIK